MGHSSTFKPSCTFVDLGGLLANPTALSIALDMMSVQAGLLRTLVGGFDAVVAVDARGFLFGPAVACSLNLPLAMARAPGKLPGGVAGGGGYATEYGDRRGLELQDHVGLSGKRVLLVDDFWATGGTFVGAARAAAAVGATVVAGLCLVDVQVPPKALADGVARDGRRFVAAGKDYSETVAGYRLDGAYVAVAHVVTLQDVLEAGSPCLDDNGAAAVAE